MIRQRRPWVIILAGGDGRRLNGVLVSGLRIDRPKQFCCLGGSESLLRDTLRRAELITDRSRIMAVVRDDHRRWWLSELRQLPSGNVLTQADNRGTGVAILHALVHVLQRDEDPTLVILPSDHAVEDETVLAESIGWAARIAEESREHLVLLGVTPEHAEPEYGWIMPERADIGHARAVLRFVEKPAAPLAAELMVAGALWNSFICATSGHALLEMFEGGQPRMFRRYLEAVLVQSEDVHAGNALFRALPPVDFSRDIVQAASVRLRVLAVPPCGWTDLGTPRRLEQWLQRHWMESGAARAIAS
jgi:mannose-1-phosphate guanylyltransferase